MAAKQFWSNAGVDPGNEIVNLGSFNRRIISDPTVDRWIAAGLSAQSTDNLVMFARSDTSDPTGTWKAVSVVGNDGQVGKFADFTNLGIDADGVYVSTNNYLSLTSFLGVQCPMVFGLPKADLLANTPTTAKLSAFGSDDLHSYGLQSIQPVIDFGASKGHAPLVRVTPTSPGSTPLHRLDLTGTSGPGASLSSPTSIYVSDYHAPPAAGQPDQTHSISTVDGRITSQVYQVGDTIYAVHDTTQDGRAARSVIALDEPTNQLVQEVILADPNYDYFNASIADSDSGNSVIGFTRSGTGQDGSLSAYAMVGRIVNGVMTFDQPFLLKQGSVDDYHAFNDRWGDFTTTVVDPSDPRVFWTFQEFAAATDVWGSQITQSVVPEPRGIVLLAVGMIVLLAMAWRWQRGRCLTGV